MEHINSVHQSAEQERAEHFQSFVGLVVYNPASSFHFVDYDRESDLFTVYWEGGSNSYMEYNGTPEEIPELMQRLEFIPPAHFFDLEYRNQSHTSQYVSMDQESRLYFAYGSNINLGQMAYRCPDATRVGPVVLEDYELLFRGNSRECGVATIRPKQGSKVYGLLWKLTPKCEKSLDIYEGFPSLYEKQDVTVRDAVGREHRVMAYVMTRERTRKPSIPTATYYYGIEEGFLQNALPVKPLYDALDQVLDEVRTQTQTQRQNKHSPKNRSQER